METVRAFIAIDINDELRGRLGELQRKLKKGHANVRWTQPKGIHLTLVFLGDVSSESIDPIRTALDRTCRGIKCFELEAMGIGTFGRPGHPRVIWAGIAPSAPLTSLQQQIVERLEAQGIDFDRKPFSPHLTLGRVKGIDRHTDPLLEKIEKYADASIGTARINHVGLIRSDLTPRGAEYTVLHRSLLT
jgi:2'-5' RNA ligase